MSVFIELMRAAYVDEWEKIGHPSRILWIPVFIVAFPLISLFALFMQIIHWMHPDA